MRQAEPGSIGFAQQEAGGIREPNTQGRPALGVNPG